jgi:hypothetical protein
MGGVRRIIDKDGPEKHKVDVANSLKVIVCSIIENRFVFIMGLKSIRSICCHCYVISDANTLENSAPGGVGALAGSQTGSWFWGECLGLVLGVLLTYFCFCL